MSSRCTHHFSLGRPHIEDTADVVSRHPDAFVHQLPCFSRGDHNSLLSTVVNHLHIVATATRADVSNTWPLSVVFSRNLRQYWQ